MPKNPGMCTSRLGTRESLHRNMEKLTRAMIGVIDGTQGRLMSACVRGKGLQYQRLVVLSCRTTSNLY